MSGLIPPFAPYAIPPAIKDRPHCPNCNKVLTPLNQPIMRPGSCERVSREWTGEYVGWRMFCTEHCARDFGELAHLMGFRKTFSETNT